MIAKIERTKSGKKQERKVLKMNSEDPKKLREKSSMKQSKEMMVSVEEVKDWREPKVFLSEAGKEKLSDTAAEIVCK